MDTRLFAFAESRQLDVASQQELLRLVKDIVNDSLAAGRSVLEFDSDPSAPLSVSDFAAEPLPGAPTATHGAWQEAGQARPQSMTPEQRYENLGTLGIGSMGEVHKVKDLQLNRIVAMKVMREELLEDETLVARFIEEAQATAQLEHPGIIPLHDLGQLEDGRYYFTMKEIRGRNLGDVIGELHENSRYHRQWSETYDGWTMRRMVRALHTVCTALGYAHNRGVIHRDLKPENVMLGAFGEVLVLDWGLVKVMEDGGQDHDEGGVQTYRADDERFATVSGAVIGTPMYMSPEQALGNVEVDIRADVYSLGALLYEILSGRSPYEGNDYIDVLDKLLSGAPDPLNFTEEQLHQKLMVNPYFRQPLPVPEELAQVCYKAMSREPDDRYVDGAALGLAIEHWLSGLEPEVR